jgi:hypothetical protein
LRSLVLLSTPQAAPRTHAPFIISTSSFNGRRLWPGVAAGGVGTVHPIDHTARNGVSFICKHLCHAFAAGANITGAGGR